jgi:Holliday junction resolvase RusA-like endonuclease
VTASLSLTIKGPPRSKKNSMQAMCIGGKPRLLQSKLYLAYERDALKQLWAVGNLQFFMPVHVVCTYWVPDKRKRDLTNLMAATHDILEKSQLIKNDDLILSVDGSRIAGVDRENPRTEITITEVPQGVEWWK